MSEDLKARLLAKRAETESGMPEADVEIPGMGTVRVRALTRLEAIHAQKASGVVEMDRRIIALGMVDPAMTEADVADWTRVAPAGELDPVANKITELSGIQTNAGKAAYKSVRR